MPARSRRRVLHGAVAALTALAGCSDSTTTDGPSPADRPPNVEPDPDAVALRSPEEDATVAWLPPEDAASTTGSPKDTPPEDGRHRALVASRTTADRFRFAEVDGAEAARQFVAETDFESETLYLERRRVRECFTLELCYVTWSDTEIDTQYGSYYRDADVSCRADAEGTTTWLVRIPDVLDPDAVSSYGSGWSSNGCRYPPYVQDPTANRDEAARSTTDRGGTTRGERTTNASETEADR